jgi:hypothetical protein
MTAHAPDRPAFPVRGVPGGWRDVWDPPDDHAQLRAAAEAAEQRLGDTAARIGEGWQAEMRDERRQMREAWRQGAS